MRKSRKLDPIQDNFRADFSFLNLQQTGSGTAGLPFTNAWDSHYVTITLSVFHFRMRREISSHVLITRKQKFEQFLSRLKIVAASFSSLGSAVTAKPDWLVSC